MWLTWVSNYKKFKSDTSNWTPTWSHADYVTNRRSIGEAITIENFVIDTINSVTKCSSMQYRILLVAFCTYGAKKFDHITPLLKGLRWQPIRQQLYFRFAVLVFKCMTRCAPEYLTSKLVRRSTVSTRNTRNSQLLNYIPLFHMAFLNFQVEACRVLVSLQLAHENL